MSVVIDQPHLIDTLRYRVHVQKIVVHDDIRVRVPIVAVIRASDRDQAALERQIRDALGALVQADWAFSGIQREDVGVGYERVMLTATARVPARENFDLAGRAQRASREGLTLDKPVVDYGLTPDRISQVVEELQLEVLDKVARQAQRFAESSGRTWRIGDIEFGMRDDSWHRRTGKGAYRDEEDIRHREFEGLDERDEVGITGAERIYLVAMVTLKAVAA